jgi:hypothetical protein
MSVAAIKQFMGEEGYSDITSEATRICRLLNMLSSMAVFSL